MSYEEVKVEAEKHAQREVDAGRGLFRFLTGEEDARTTPLATPVPEQKAPKEQSGWFSSVTGLFSGIKGSSKSGTSDPANSPAFTEGEVHADLVMVCLFRRFGCRRVNWMLYRTTKDTTSSATSWSTCLVSTVTQAIMGSCLTWTQIPTPGILVGYSLSERMASGKRNRLYDGTGSRDGDSSL